MAIARRAVLALIGGGLLASVAGVRGQAVQRRTYRIGLLGAESMRRTHADLELLQAGLRELGYAEGAGIKVEIRAANSDYGRLPGLARELAESGVDVLVASGSKAGIAAKEATSTIPVVVSNMGDAVEAGFSGSFSRPGSNVTGISMMNPEVTVKQLELLREVKPGIVRAAVLMNPANPNYALTLAALRRAAGPLACGSSRSTRSRGGKSSARSALRPTRASTR